MLFAAAAVAGSVISERAVSSLGVLAVDAKSKLPDVGRTDVRNLARGLLKPVAVKGHALSVASTFMTEVTRSVPKTLEQLDGVVGRASGVLGDAQGKLALVAKEVSAAGGIVSLGAMGDVAQKVVGPLPSPALAVASGSLTEVMKNAQDISNDLANGKPEALLVSLSIPASLPVSVPGVGEIPQRLSKALPVSVPIPVQIPNGLLKMGGGDMISKSISEILPIPVGRGASTSSAVALVPSVLLNPDVIPKRISGFLPISAPLSLPGIPHIPTSLADLKTLKNSLKPANIAHRLLDEVTARLPPRVQADVCKFKQQVETVVIPTVRFWTELIKVAAKNGFSLDVVMKELQKKALASIAGDLHKIFPSPDNPVGHEERKAIVHRVLNQVEDGVVEVISRFGMNEQGVRKHYDEIKPHAEVLIVTIGDLIEEHPVLAETLLFVALAMVMPQGFFTKYLLQMLGIGPPNPAKLKGSLMVWGKKVVIEWAIPVGKKLWRLDFAIFKYGPPQTRERVLVGFGTGYTRFKHE